MCLKGYLQNGVARLQLKAVGREGTNTSQQALLPIEPLICTELDLSHLLKCIIGWRSSTYCRCIINAYQRSGEYRPA